MQLKWGLKRNKQVQLMLKLLFKHFGLSLIANSEIIPHGCPDTEWGPWIGIKTFCSCYRLEVGPDSSEL